MDSTKGILLNAINYYSKPLTVFAKSSFLDVWQGSEYVLHIVAFRLKYLLVGGNLKVTFFLFEVIVLVFDFLILPEIEVNENFLRFPSFRFQV